MLGRKEERLAIERLLAEAGRGRSGVLAIVGEPGIGKSTLLDHAAERAAGMRVVRAQGVDSEVELPFAGLSELLRPMLGELGRIPAPQAAALEGALALGPVGAQDRFAVGAATLSLVSAFAEDRPLVLLVDDAHLLDEASTLAILFAARRLLADPVALILAAREGESSLVGSAGLRTLRPGGLDRAEAAELLDGAGVSDAAVDRLHRATGGNPLALLQLAPEAGRLEPFPSEAPVPISTSIVAAFRRRYDPLPAPTRTMLTLAAAGETGDLAVLAAAASRLGVAVGDLVPAEREGLVRIDGEAVRFLHPLARSAVYGAASADDRRRAHAALAAALAPHEVERRAWHLAAASVGPDAEASAALAAAGDRARERTAYSVASAAFRRGAGLAASADARARLLFAAADSAWLGGNADRTVELLASARSHASDALLVARIERLRGHVQIRRGPVMDGCRVVIGAAEGIAATDPELAAVMFAEAVYGGFYAGETDVMVAAAERAAELARPLDSRRAAFFAAMARAIAMVVAGEGDTGARAAREAVAILDESDELGGDATMLAWAALGPLWLREAGVGQGLVDRAVEQARRDGAVGAMPALLHNVARDEATSDRWRDAEATYAEAIGLARESGQRTELAAALAGLAWLEARQGREEACRRHAAEAQALCAELGVGLFGIWTIQSLGDLDLGLGRPAAAAVHHEAQLQVLLNGGIVDADLSPVPELVEEYLRLGRGDDAATVAVDFLAAAEAKGQPWALARAARCRGLLAEPDRLEPWFERGIGFHERTPDGFEAARTRLAYGARLRRTRRRARAREQLRAALDIFETLGAKPWAEQAVAELAATGETARRREAATIDDLTPRERQIAGLLAEGRTTREAAAAAFLSPKTVEYHLGHVYRKLGIRSRAELAAALQGP